MERLLIIVLFSSIPILSFSSIAKDLEDLQTVNNSAEKLTIELQERPIVDADLKVINHYRDMALSLLKKVPLRSFEYDRTYEILGTFGEIYYTEKKYKELVKLLIPIIHLPHDIPFNLGIGRSYYWVGKSYYRIGEYTKSLQYLEAAIPIMEENNDENLHTVFSNIGVVYKNLELYTQAIKYLQKSKRIRLVRAPEKLPSIYSNLAIAYLHIGKLDSCEEHLKLFFNSTDDERLIHHAFANRGRLLEEKGIRENNNSYFISAIEDHKRALDIRLRLNQLSDKFNSYINIGANFDYIDILDSALYYYRMAQSIELKSKDIKPSSRIKLRENIADIYFKQNQFKYSINYLRQVADSVQIGSLGPFDYKDKKIITERLGKTIEKIKVSQSKQFQLILILSFCLLAAILTSIIFWQINRRRKLQSENQEILGRHGKDLADERVKTQEEVLKKIASEIHDRIQNYIWAWKLGICETEEQKTHSRLNSLSEIVRDISHQLYPPPSKDGLDLSLRELCEQLNKNKHLNIEFHSWQVVSRRFFSSVETNIYRIVQEALNNILKYSKAKEVSIQLIHHNDPSEYLSLCIEDDGIGFDIEKEPNGIGISTMKDRAESLNGTLIIDSSPGNGTSIFVNIPAEFKSIDRIE